MSKVEEITEETKLFNTEIPDVYLFVCTGNTCRSPIAAALFNELYRQRGVAVSAGLCADGSPISANAVAVLKERGIKSSGTNNYESHISRQLTKEAVENAKLVICLTGNHAMSIISVLPEYAEKICVLGEISDPFGQGIEAYRKCLTEIEQALNNMFGEDNDKN